MRERGDLARGIVAGVGAGLFAAFVMNQFQALWMSMAKPSDSDAAPATLVAANKVSQAVAGESVPGKAEETASNTVHYATGAALGALYGVGAEFTPGIKTGLGTSYAGAVWAALDNGLVPTLKLSPPPSKTAPKDHLFAFASHLVFGVSLELSRRVLAVVL